VIDF
jgi:hypothetical protein